MIYHTSRYIAMLVLLLTAAGTQAAERFSFAAIGDTPYRVPAQFAHFERLMVFGDNEVHGVLVDVDIGDPDVFSFRIITVRENVEPAGKP